MSTVSELSEWTDEQREIHRRLETTPFQADLYRSSRNQRKSLSLLSSIKDLVLREIEYEQGDNIAAPMKNHITVGDFRLLSHDFEGGFATTAEMSQRLLAYRLVELYRDQVDVNQEETLCFNLNTCGINQRGSSYSEVDAHFEEMFNFEETPDVFTKKYLIFPTYDGTAAYCTLVINPIGAIRQKEENESECEQCVMLHIGFDREKNLMSYKKRVAPRIEKLMGLFMNLYGEQKGYLKLETSQIIKDVVLANGPVHRNNRPYQLIHLVDKLLNSYPISDYNHIIKDIKKDYKKGNIVKMTREAFMISVRAEITFGTDNVAICLLRTTEQTANNIRSEREANSRQNSAAAQIPVQHEEVVT